MIIDGTCESIRKQVGMDGFLNNCSGVAFSPLLITSYDGESFSFATNSASYFDV